MTTSLYLLLNAGDLSQTVSIMEDAIKMEKVLKEWVGQVASAEARRLDAIIMGREVNLPTDASTNAPEDGSGYYSPSIMGVPVIISEHVPDDAIYTIEKMPSLKFTPDLTIGYERKSELFFITSAMQIESLPLFYGDYVGLPGRPEFWRFTWPRYLALSLLVISLIVIMLLVAR